MNSYEKYQQLLREVQIIIDEAEKNWSSESSGFLVASFGESLQYIRRITDGFRDTLEQQDSNPEKSSLSDFTF